jgi:hypothetical protein
MTPTLDSHLTPDEIDAWLGGELASERQGHLQRCADCRAIAGGERLVAALLARLPLLAPTDGFADRVMARVTLPEAQLLRSWRAFRGRLRANPRTLAAAAMIAVALLGSMGASAAWSLSHQATITAAGDWLQAQAGQWFWLGLQGAFSTVVEQPWFGELRPLLATPLRFALIATALSVAYLGGLVALQRLLTAPATGVSRAGY